MTGRRTGYAPVGELSMYYEIRGSGPPLVLLHGAYMTAEMMGELATGLAAARQVIVAELEGHGRTADADRPITYEQMADDTAGLLRHLGVDQADVVGFSMGGGIALQLALRHPGVVRRLVVMSASFTHDGMQAEALELFPTITPELFAGSPAERAYQELAPDPGRFPALVEKLVRLDSTPFAWPEDQIRAIPAPTMIIVGDADLVRLEHAVELFRLRGGGAMGDFGGLPPARLAVLPGTTHFLPPGSGVIDRTEWLLEMLAAFLDAPDDEAAAPG